MKQNNNPFLKYRGTEHNRMNFELAQANNVNLITPSESWYKRPLLSKLKLPHNVSIMSKYGINIMDEIVAYEYSIKS